MFHILSWNVRGLNDQNKRCLVRSVVSKFRGAVLCLQESKVEVVSRSFLREFAGPCFDKCHFVRSVGSAGGIVTCWNSKLFSCTEVIVRRFSLTVRLKVAQSGSNIYITNVYGPPSWEGKEEFCNELLALDGVCSGGWVVCGDFNLTRSLQERRGRCWSRRLMELFNNLINNLRLIDVPMGNQEFTWSNLQRRPTLAKLDRFLISTEWDLEFPLTRVEALPRVTSDHSPILLSTGDKPPNRMFRMEEVWLARADFCELVPSWWKEQPSLANGALTLAAKIRHCRRRIKEWCKNSFHSILNAKKTLAEEIHRLNVLEEQEDLTPPLFDNRSQLRVQLRGVVAQEEVLWKTRSRQLWLKEGDGNTKFFHAVANGRRRTNYISVVEDNGRVVRREEEKREYFYAKFKELFAPSTSLGTEFGDWSLLFGRKKFLNPGVLTAPFSEAEVRKATFQLGSDKAPGPDGFNLRFYQRFWDVVKDDIMAIFRDLFDGRLNSGPLDYAYICLIPKKEGAIVANDFRPISLINGVQKIISKVLANRLKGVLDDVISPSQAAFLKGRSILDSFATASVISSWSTASGGEVVGIKADFEKAYDKVSWVFLREVLRGLGAEEKWCDWVEQCTTNAKVAALVNGVPTKWIKNKRGLRQGDPLSPYLFLLVAEGLARLLNEAGGNGLINGVGPKIEDKVALIQYADDTLFFCEAKRRQVRNLRFVWRLFEWASGLKVNLSKTELYYFGRREARGGRLAEILGCKRGYLPTRYLGLPLSTKRLRREDWWTVIEKIAKRIEGWQTKLLSQGGRLVLVNSVLSNLPLYFFSVFRAPKWVIRRVEALRRAFFWKGSTSVLGGQCLVRWEIVCRSKDDGGLGVLNLDSMNLALLTKWWWKFFSDRRNIWANQIEGAYYSRRKPLKEGASFKPESQWWRSVLATRDIFKCGVCYSVREGGSTDWWNDIWNGHASLRTLFPTIYEQVRSKNRRVKECWGARGWRWRMILAGFEPRSQREEEQITQLRLAVPMGPSGGTRDVVEWRWGLAGSFSVNSVFKFLQVGGVTETRYSKIWRIKAPLKVRCFVWLVLRNRVLTVDNLLKRGWSGSEACELCSEANETGNHLFLTCRFTKELLHGLLVDKVFLRSCETPASLWEDCARKGGSYGRGELQTLASVWWSIWLERNRRIFDRKKAALHRILADIRSNRSAWSSFCPG